MKLLETIRSRTQRFTMKGIDTADIEQTLITKRGIDAETAHNIARVANGNWNKAIDTLSAGNENNMFFELFTMLMRMAYSRKVKEIKKWSDTAASFGREKQKRMLLYFMRMVRENFMFNFHQPELVYMTTEEQKFATRFSPFINEANVIEINDLFARALRDISQNANSKIVMYDMALKLIVSLIRKP